MVQKFPRYGRMKRAVSLPLAVILLVTAGTGCLPASKTPPNVLLDRALSGMAGQDQLRFDGEAELRVGEDMIVTKQFRYEGEVRQHKGIHMRLSPQAEHTTTEKRWNPLKQLDELKKIPQKKVERLAQAHAAAQGASRENGASKVPEALGGKQAKDLIALEVYLSDEDAKRIYTAQIEEDFNRLVIPNVQLNQVKTPLSQRERKDLQAKLKTIADEGRKELRQRLNEAKVQAKYRIWVERRQSLPAYMEGWITALYTEQNQPRKETIHVKSRFIYP
ncbi:hypothetical protein [Paenibacillus apiarius]|uniref:Lipoprotein n=1 Tax=Paenibacillus apiarius TaxID=46240 RepID=A0ABT4DN88_9BACL|nr:hypothetical protein [Paenibacillus apiarius]MCY9513669.1 hypothetical protein [Paenibacillus apiarius]MCY9518220.1 hypothetical protein [Paenibacillus apiarius]MCY9551379.1 hypothetical protein [Paenibacillus apiarius]MCY9558533.1 hypothetical protein [Paenibacillus apiarius]MCY9684153.1 hypothetical protein [Paenibacillus apiarius]